jgi:hypothetical protein
MRGRPESSCPAESAIYRVAWVLHSRSGAEQAKALISAANVTASPLRSNVCDRYRSPCLHRTL